MSKFVSVSVKCTLVLCLSAAIAACTQQSPPETYLDTTQPTEARLDDLLSRMTLEEKVSLVHADTWFTSPSIDALNVQALHLSDGAMGIREDQTLGGYGAAFHTADLSTAMPCSIALAATWNLDLANQYGAAIGQEAIVRGKNVMLGPAINILRTPLGGRNWEYFSEDPFLVSRLTVAYIRGEQSQGVASTVKHFAANNQETRRGRIDVQMDERTLREIYLPGFEAAVREAGVWCVMAAYNKFRGDYCAENDYLLNQVLKKEWGFQGIVMSDWGAVHSTIGSALHGMDLEMGTRKPFDQYYLAHPLIQAVQDGKVPESVVDEMARRNLRIRMALHLIGPATQPSNGSMNTYEHQLIARHVAEEAMVLLKNDNQELPLDLSKIKRIAVIGENATVLFCHSGSSTQVKTPYEVNALNGILARAGGMATISYSVGYSTNSPAPSPDQPTRFGPATQPTTRPAGPIPPAHRPLAHPAERIAAALAAAKDADIVIFVGGLRHTFGSEDEGADRPNLKLPGHQAELIEQLAAVNPHIIVVLVGSGPIEMPWLDQVPAVVQEWYPGMEGGNALAAILFGDVNPSGKLPLTFPKQLSDSPAHALGAFPGNYKTETYSEGLLVGYRWFDAKNIEPLFPFGYGLSYTKFDYSNVKLTPATQPSDPVVSVQCDVTNTGGRDGAEVVQLYVHPNNAPVPRPEKELKGFAKVFVPKGQTMTVTIPLNARSFAYYDPGLKGWIAQQGDYTLLLGSSSRDIRQKADFTLEQSILEK